MMSLTRTIQRSHKISRIFQRDSVPILTCLQRHKSGAGHSKVQIKDFLYFSYLKKPSFCRLEFII